MRAPSTMIAATLLLASLAFFGTASAASSLRGSGDLVAHRSLAMPHDVAVGDSTPCNRRRLVSSIAKHMMHGLRRRLAMPHHEDGNATPDPCRCAHLAPASPGTDPVHRLLLATHRLLATPHHDDPAVEHDPNACGDTTAAVAPATPSQP